MLSSFNVPIRSAVMIACLIGVPLAAVVTVRRSPAEDTHIVVIQPAGPDQARMSASDPGLAPADDRVVLARSIDRDADRHTTQLTSLAVPVPEASSRGSHRPGPPVFWEDQPSVSDQTRGAGQRLTQPVRPNSPRRGDQPAAAHEAANVRPPKPGLQPSGNLVADDAPAEPVPPPQGGAAPSMPSPEQFGDLEQRLRKLGARHYRLETWGAQGELFRFRCMMDLDGRSDGSRYFEATDPDALTAFRRVLEQVERWRAGHGRE